MLVRSMLACATTARWSVRASWRPPRSYSRSASPQRRHAPLGAAAPQTPPRSDPRRLACVGKAASGLQAPPISVGVALEYEGSVVGDDELEELADGLEADEELELSLVFCDDKYIAGLNQEWRGVAGPTDVLSLEMVQDSTDAALPVRVLGDVVISIDTAARQAAERGGAEGGGKYSLRDELRVLLVHGVLHVLGMDHERSEAEAAQMAEEEAAVLASLGWRGQGLVEAAATAGGSEATSASTSSKTATTNVGLDALPSLVELKKSAVLLNSAIHVPPADVKLVCIDMDGTLLNSCSQLSAETAEAVRRVCALDGVRVLLATGKARPAAMAALATSGLIGPDGILHERGPGVFLQGLATYDPNGSLLPGPSLPADVVRSCFAFAEDHGVACVAFLGDTCVSTQMREYVRELHTRYYEPLADIVDLEAILQGPPVRKILFMTDARVVQQELKPHFDAALVGSGAEWTQAVDTMLEVVPAGSNKWGGVLQYLDAVELHPSDVMAIGDGSNDLAMLASAGTSVAMGNAMPGVQAVADYITSDNDHNGVALALEVLVLSGYGSGKQRR